MGVEKLTIISPGRINLIGEHTDYNMGYVLPAAIDKTIRFEISGAVDDVISLTAKDIGESFEFDPLHLQVDMPQWATYCVGIVDQLNQMNINVSGIHCAFGGDIPVGAGLSSSAALGCGFLYALNELFDLRISRLEMVQIAQKSENEFVGVKCGIMDQYACVFGEPNSFVKIDCRTFEHEVITGDFKGFDLILCDTKVKHSLASTEYNTRRTECEQGVAIIQQLNPQVKSLRDANLNDLAVVRDKMSSAIFDRCTYVIQENARVVDAVKAIENNDMAWLGRLMCQSHDGLSKQYKVSCDELDILADFANSHKAALGARMMGGGFGGCTINLVKSDMLDLYKNEISAHFKQQTGVEISIYDINISNGVHAASELANKIP